jgi:hypothetical protein
METQFSKLLIMVAEEEIRCHAREIGGNNLGPFVAKYLAPTGLQPPQPWCAAFVSWCVRRVHSILGTRQLQPYTASALGMLRSLRDLGAVVGNPRPGGLVFWRRGSRGRGLGHVGIIVATYAQTYETIEGNRTPEVSRFRYRTGRGQAPLAFALPC